MVRYCVAFGCSESYKKGNGVQFHKFPRSRPKLLESWESAVRRKNWRSTVHSTLCSKHFTEDSYQVRPGALVKYLKDDAVPSIFSFNITEIRKPPRRQFFYKTAEVIETSNEPKEIEAPNQTKVMEIEYLDHKEGQSRQINKETQTDDSLCSPTKELLRKKVKRLQSIIQRRDKKIETLSQLLISTLKGKVKIT